MNLPQSNADSIRNVQILRFARDDNETNRFILSEAAFYLSEAKDPYELISGPVLIIQQEA